MPDNTSIAATEKPSSTLTVSELRRRALSGTILVAIRGTAVRLFGLGGNVALARLLLPRELGTVAFGLAILAFATFLSDGGLGVGLIRRKEEPTLDELRSLMALQLVVTTALGGAIAGVGAPLGRIGAVTAVMMPALPLLGLRAPGMIVLERSLTFRPVVMVEVVEVFVYYAFAVIAVSVGAGVWGLAAASIARAFSGTALLLRIAPIGLVAPVFSWRALRGLLAFGVRFQAVLVTNLIRDQGVNVGTAIIAGTSTLGVWTLAYRILQLPFLLFEAMWRVSYPAMAQLLVVGADVRAIIERAIRVAATVTGFVLTVLVGCTPAFLPVVFGHHWDSARGVIPFAAAALQISGPISVATAGFLFASDRTDVVLRGVIVQAAVWFAVAFPLLHTLGVSAIGLGWFCAALSESIVLARATGNAIEVRILRQLVLPVALASASGAGGWILTVHQSPTVLALIEGAAVSGGSYLLSLALLRRELMFDAIRLLRRGFAPPTEEGA